MKNISKNIQQALLIPVFLATTLVAITYLTLSNIKLVETSGSNSLGLLLLISVAIINIIFFPIFYSKKAKSDKLSRKQLIFNIITLTTAVTITAVLIAILFVIFVNSSFKGLALDKYTASAVIGLYSTINIYVLAGFATALDPKSITRLFTLIMFSGIALSMTTSTNPLWWQENFSSLGTKNSLSGDSFNLTLTLSGLLIIVLASHIVKIVSSDKRLIKTNTRMLRNIFIALGICIAGVGFFPYDLSPLMHNLSAYSTVLVFAVLIVFIKKIIPSIDRVFQVNSIFLLGFIFFCYWLFVGVSYLNLTAFEIIAFSITFLWLIMFVNYLESTKAS